MKPYIEIRKAGEGSGERFNSADDAGAWLRNQGWPPGLVYAPDADRVGLAECLAGSPWEVFVIWSARDEVH